MTPSAPIPVFTLFGETDPFPDVLHQETFSARAPLHGWRISAHRHGQIAQLLTIRTGQMQAKLDGRTYTLGDGDFLFVPVQSVHDFVFRPGTEGHVTSFPVSLIKTIGPVSDELTQALSRPLHGALDSVLSQMIAQIGAQITRPGPFRQQICVALAHSVLGLIAARAGTNSTAHPTKDKRLAQLDALIATHLASGWGASDYAAALSLTTGHLSRLCRAATGQGATAYVEQALMAEACRLLAFTQLPVAEIGYRLGYGDASHFSKRFRRVQQQSPSAYRQRFAPTEAEGIPPRSGRAKGA